MCTNMGAGARRAAAPAAPAAQAAAPAAQAAAPAAAQQAAPAQQQTTDGRLASAMGIASMDDATLAALVDRAMRASMVQDGRQPTEAQRLADAFGFSANRPESVSQEALAAHRGRKYEDGTIYRTVIDAGNKSGRQIAHELASAHDYGLNFGGGRAYGTGLYFAGTGSSGTGNAGARESYWYGRGRTNAYMIEARIKPGAKIAKSGDLSGAKAQAWISSHRNALQRLGIRTMNGRVVGKPSSMSSDDLQTTLAMMMGYDGYRNSDTSTPYYTIWNRGALQVARGNKYTRAGNGQL